jgi:hypothetical protein
MRSVRFHSLLALAGLAIAVALAGSTSAQQTLLTIDDFNVDEGHFFHSPGFSGSSNGFQKLAIETADPDPIAPNPSTAVHDTTDSADTFGSGGSQLIELFDDLDQTTLEPNGGTARLRNVSSRGIANPADPLFTQTQFTTGPDDDGWIGVAVKTLDPGWTVQIYMELSPNTVPTVQSEHHGSVPKDVINDGEWHFYQWSLDDFTGGPDGWFSVAGIIGNAGSAVIEDGAHTIDSVIFRQSDFTQVPSVDNVRKSTLHMDWVVKSNTGMIELPSQPTNDADFDDDGDVDAADFNTWVNGFGLVEGGTETNGDANGDGAIDGDDFLAWQQQFNPPAAVAGAVPEPAAAALALAAIAALAHIRRR